VSATAEQSTLNAFTTPISEYQVSPYWTKMDGHRVRVALPDDMNPHINVVIPHCAGKNHVKFFPPDQVQYFGCCFSGQRTGLRKTGIAGQKKDH
jgi:hypothetical protein